VPAACPNCVGSRKTLTPDVIVALRSTVPKPHASHGVQLAMNAIRIGCSGWNYKDWRGPFYPQDMPVKNWFAFYAQTFDTVEINNSFYRLPKPEVFAKWRDQAPPGFCYAVKASRYLTHNRKLNEPEAPLNLMIGNARHLEPHLGPLLYQLPPHWKLNRERLEYFLARLPSDLTHVLEFRDESWMTEEVLALLDAHGVAFCTHDMPGMKVPRWASGKAAYVRFHGGVSKYRGRYLDSALQSWADWMIEQEKSGRDVWAYFNNDYDADAIQDALTLRAMVRQTKR
jgi:uncharacterized protein YecE (DUF72 family)